MNQIIERKRAHERYVHRNLCIGNQTDADVTGFICLQFHPFKGILRRGRRGRQAGEDADDEAVERDEGRAGEERDRKCRERVGVNSSLPMTRATASARWSWLIFQAGVFAGCEYSTCTLGGVEPPKMYAWREKCASCISTGKDTCGWTIEPTRGAPGQSFVDPIDPVFHGPHSFTHAFAGCVLHMYIS